MALVFLRPGNRAGQPPGKIACVFKNPENAGTVKCRKMSFGTQSYLFSPHAVHPEPEVLNIQWRLKSRLFQESCLFKGHNVQQGSQWLQFFVLCFKDYYVETV
jgi:hypothetical protein